MASFGAVSKTEFRLVSNFFCAKKLKPVLGYNVNLKPVWTNRSYALGIAVGVTYVITYDKIFGVQLTGIDSVGGQKLPFPIDKASCH